LGGDGTCHEVVNGLFLDGVPVHRRAVFAVLPFGTGGDLVRTLQVKKNLQDALWVASTGMTLPLDVIKLTFPKRQTEICINVVGFGINALVCELANKSAKRFGGTATFLGSILRALRTFEPMPVSWSWDGPDGTGAVTMETHAAFCANGQYCGAGLFVGKRGSMADGLLDLSIVPKMPALNAVRHLPKLYTGDFHTVPGVVQARVTRVEVASVIPIETDGESVGDAPVVIEVLPRALMVRGGWLKPPVGMVEPPENP
jgi:diacylglycerol kinase family enzyme